MSGKMNAATFEGPYKNVVQKKPKPVIREPTDAIIKVSATGICGRWEIPDYHNQN